MAATIAFFPFFSVHFFLSKSHQNPPNRGERIEVFSLHETDRLLEFLEERELIPHGQFVLAGMWFPRRLDLAPLNEQDPSRSAMCVIAEPLRNSSSKNIASSLASPNRTCQKLRKTELAV